jgi:hypothetical protein
MPESTDFERRFKAALDSINKKKSEVIRQSEGDDPLVGLETTEGDDGNTEKVSQARPTVINLFQHPDAHPIVLDLCLLKKYGTDWLEWEEETLEWRIPKDFRTSEVSSLNMGKIQAMKTLYSGDSFWERWEVFNWCVQPFNNIYVDFEVLQVPSTGQIMVAVDISKQVRSGVEWSEEVRMFMQMVCKHDGIFCPPVPLDFIKVDTDNGFIDHDEIKERWPAVRIADKFPTEETITAEQLRRNLDAHRFLMASKQRLHDQVGLVLHE